MVNIMAKRRKSKIRLTVAVSCYQKQPFFRSALDSILAVIKDRTDTELLICDDGSPGGGDGDIAREYAKQYKFIRVLKNPGNKGIKYSYSRLVEEAKGDYFMPFDCDDILLPFNLDNNMEFLDANPHIAATYGKKRYFKDNRDLSRNGGGDHSVFVMSYLPRTTHNAMFIRMSDLKEVGGYSSPLFHTEIKGPVDVTMWVSLALKKDLLFVDEYRLLYREHDNQYTMSHKKEYMEEYRTIRREIGDNYPELYQAIHNRTQFFVPVELVRPAAVLFGAEVMRPDLTPEIKLGLLDQIEQLIPGDMGVYECRLNILKHLGRWGEVYDKAQVMYLKSNGKRYSQLFALNVLLEAAEKLHVPAHIFQDLKKQVSLQFFAMTQEHHRIFQSVLANNGYYSAEEK